jgi:hypothetical protein
LQGEAIVIGRLDPIVAITAQIVELQGVGHHYYYVFNLVGFHSVLLIGFAVSVWTLDAFIAHQICSALGVPTAPIG